MKIPNARRLKGGQWYIYLRLGGEGYGITGATEKDVARKATLFKAEYLAGNKKSSAGDLTLREAIQKYINTRVLSPSTVVGYDRIMRTHFAPYMDKRVSASVPWETAIRDELRHYSVKSVKNAWGLVMTVLREYNQQPPKIRFPDPPPPKEKYLPSDELTRFLAEIRGDTAELGALLALHSLRASEIFALTAADYDRAAGTISVHNSVVRDISGNRVEKATNKTADSTRKIRVMIPRLKELLDAAADIKGYLVPCAENTLRRHINSACERAGLTQTGIHGLRHTFASLAHHVGLTEQETMEIGGWSDVRTMRKIYQHLERADRLRAENKMAAWYADQERS